MARLGRRLIYEGRSNPSDSKDTYYSVFPVPRIRTGSNPGDWVIIQERNWMEIFGLEDFNYIEVKPRFLLRSKLKRFGNRPPS
jgi:hypothetical protein